MSKYIILAGPGSFSLLASLPEIEGRSAKEALEKHYGFPFRANPNARSGFLVAKVNAQGKPGNRLLFTVDQ